MDAVACENGGLATDYTANECGLSAASPQVEYWQNRFDQEILQFARADGVPARLLKNLFIRESQLWPGIYHDVQEVGLGQLTLPLSQRTLALIEGFARGAPSAKNTREGWHIATVPVVD